MILNFLLNRYPGAHFFYNVQEYLILSLGQPVKLPVFSDLNSIYQLSLERKFIFNTQSWVLLCMETNTFFKSKAN